MLTMNSGIFIHCCTLTDPLVLPSDQAFIAESICIHIAEHCKISPVSRHLFSLYCAKRDLWLSPSSEVVAGKEKLELYFRLRFKPSSLSKLKCDPHAMDYFLHQMRQDFINGKVPELLEEDLFNKTFGLVVTDVVRHLLENNQTPEKKAINYSSYMPTDLKKSLRLYFLKSNMNGALMQCYQNSRKNVTYVKERYMHEFLNLTPEYSCEQYPAQIDTGGQVWEVIIQVNPYHETQPGVRVRTKNVRNSKKADHWTHICSIEDLCFISMKSDHSDCTVEINRKNGIPQYFTFESKDMMFSFVSLLDGYYRLMEKWTFNLCKDLPTPSLRSLRAMKCHGPVGAEFSYNKLKTKGKDETGCYLLRESSAWYREICLDMYRESETPETFRIEKSSEGFKLWNHTEVFDSISKLINQYINDKLQLNLKTCITPSEYDKSRLLLCRPENKDNETIVTRGDCSCSAQCIPHSSITFTGSKSDEFPGAFSVVRRAYIRRSKDDFREVAIKSLKKDFEKNYLESFLYQSERILFWKCETIVSTVGMVLSNPLALVMEYLPLGSLDKYLRENKLQLQSVDLVEAANYIAKALWYLEEHECVHGKIRCSNILVAHHSENAFRVKLSDPGLLIYSERDIHWVPPECYYNLNLVSKSPMADVWAFGTTLWEIFSYGGTPMKNIPIAEAKRKYITGEGLPAPASVHEEIRKLMLECWCLDPDNRKRPQAIMRDVNQILYEVYNSRRSHSYASVYPISKPNITQERVPPTSPPPLPERIKEFASTLEGAKKGKKRSSFKFFHHEISYNTLSDSASTNLSESTALTDADTLIDIGSLISLGDSQNITTTGTTSPDIVYSWEIDFHKLKLDENPLGEGFYGKVYKATLTQWYGLKEEIVAVKCIKETSDMNVVNDLQREIEIMKALQHPCIVEIKGLVESPQRMLVMEYLNLGSLLAYLQMYKEKITHAQLLKFSHDIADGMEYLAMKNIVHRDLATRNILVASQDSVKISDFGLARITRENSYYRIQSDRNLPIKWYAPESIQYGKFISKSDVWSYGVTLWEMFSYGKDPFVSDIQPSNLGKDLLEDLLKGKRLAKPDDCPGEVYQLMLQCWQNDYNSRPDFTEIKRLIKDINL